MAGGWWIATGFCFGLFLVGLLVLLFAIAGASGKANREQEQYERESLTRGVWRTIWRA